MNKNRFLTCLLVFSACILLGFIFSGCSSGTNTAASPGTDQIDTGGSEISQHITARIKKGADPKAVASLVSGSVASTYEIYGMTYVRILLPAGATEEASINTLNASPLCDFAKPEYIYHHNLVPNDPQYEGRQYCHQRMQSEPAWNITTGSNSVIVAVIDSGVDCTHPEFSGRTVAGYDFINFIPLTGNENSDENGHGTHVSGIIGATGNNGQGVAGFNWQCKIMPVRVLNEDGSGTDSGIAQGIQFAVDNGAHVINMSLGGRGYSQEIQDAISAANDAGVTVVVSMGNDYYRILNFPAANSGVIAVGSTSGNDEISDYSTRGDWISCSAPGEQIYSTYSTLFSDYATLSGTSMASPQVAGLASLLKGRNFTFQPTRIRTIMEDTANDLGNAGFDDTYGYGRINAYQALLSDAADRYGSVKITVNVTGNPYSGADVVLRDTNGATVATNKTDGNGVASFFFIKSGNYTASSHVNGVTNQSGTITVNPASTVSTTIFF